jgi:hypothetical protein
MIAAPHRGSCLCGDITYEVHGPFAQDDVAARRLVRPAWIGS